MENQDNSQKKDNSGCGFWSLLIWAMALYGLLAVIDSKVTNLPFFDKIKSEVNSVFVDKTEFDDVNGFDTTEVEISANDETNKTDNQGKENLNSKSADNKNLCSSCNGRGILIGCTLCEKGKIHCLQCSGRGFEYNSGRTCLKCSGSGIAFCTTCQGNYLNHQRDCFTCDGKKYTKFVDIVCFACDGDGKDECFISRCKKGVFKCNEAATKSNHEHCSSCNNDHGQIHGEKCTYGKKPCNICNGRGLRRIETGI